MDLPHYLKDQNNNRRKRRRKRPLLSTLKHITSSHTYHRKTKFTNAHICFFIVSTDQTVFLIRCALPGPFASSNKSNYGKRTSVSSLVFHSEGERKDWRNVNKCPMLFAPALPEFDSIDSLTWIQGMTQSCQWLRSSTWVIVTELESWITATLFVLLPKT